MSAVALQHRAIRGVILGNCHVDSTFPVEVIEPGEIGNPPKNGAVRKTNSTCWVKMKGTF